MRNSMRILTLGLIALVAMSGVAAATPECPECDDDVPGNDDCAFSSADAGVVSDDSQVLEDADLCIGNADTFEEKGFWAVFSICLNALLDGFEDVTGIDLRIEGFVSQHGIDLEGWIHSPLGDVDLEEDTPVGDLDDASWDVLGDLDAALHDLFAASGADVDAHDLLPGGEELPTADADACLVDAVC